VKLKISLWPFEVTDDSSTNLSWFRAHFWDSWSDFKLEVWLLQCESSCGVLSDDRAGLSVCHISCSSSSPFIFTYCCAQITQVSIYNLLCTFEDEARLRNSARNLKKTLHFFITKINWLMLFKEIIVIYIENHAKLINTKCSFTGC
jgi:hypothetical protein